jgi:hypothetical protein
MSVPMDERAFWNQPDSRMPDYDQVYQGLWFQPCEGEHDRVSLDDGHCHYLLVPPLLVHNICVQLLHKINKAIINIILNLSREHAIITISPITISPIKFDTIMTNQSNISFIFWLISGWSSDILSWALIAASSISISFWRAASYTIDSSLIHCNSWDESSWRLSRSCRCRGSKE